MWKVSKSHKTRKRCLTVKVKKEKERSGKSESGVEEEGGGSSLLHALRTDLRVALTMFKGLFLIFVVA